jgi:hypothetical protein
MKAKISVFPVLSVASPARVVTVSRLPVLARTAPSAGPPMPANTLCPADSVPEKPATGRPQEGADFRGAGGQLERLDQGSGRDLVLRGQAAAVDQVQAAWADAEMLQLVGHGGGRAAVRGGLAAGDSDLAGQVLRDYVVALLEHLLHDRGQRRGLDAGQGFCCARLACSVRGSGLDVECRRL